MPQPATDGSGFIADRDAVAFEGAWATGVRARPTCTEAVASHDSLPACCTGHSEAIHRGLCKMWLAIEIEDFPNWFEWQQGAFELIQKNLLPIGGSSHPSCALGWAATTHPPAGHQRARAHAHTAASPGRAHETDRRRLSLSPRSFGLL